MESYVDYCAKESITVKGIVDEDFVNYKVPSMTIMFPYCDFKCEVDGSDFCQNSSLAKENNITISINDLYKRYISNPISECIVCQGLEPFDSWEELNSLLFHFKIHKGCRDDFVIYTGYNEDEISDKIDIIKRTYDNVVIKFGGFVPYNEKHYDDVLGVYLSSDNQYGKKIS